MIFLLNPCHYYAIKYKDTNHYESSLDVGFASLHISVDSINISGETINSLPCFWQTLVYPTNIFMYLLLVAVNTASYEKGAISEDRE